MRGLPIDVYNNGDLLRDFTYIDDIVKAVMLIADRPASADPGFSTESPALDRSSAPYRVYNIGNEHPEKLERFIAVLEEKLELRRKKSIFRCRPATSI